MDISAQCTKFQLIFTIIGQNFTFNFLNFNFSRFSLFLRISFDKFSYYTEYSVFQHFKSHFLCTFLWISIEINNFLWELFFSLLWTLLDFLLICKELNFVHVSLLFFLRILTDVWERLSSRSLFSLAHFLWGN